MSAAGAAEITLYEDAGFNGAQLTLRGFTPSVRNTGFNDRASSIVVNSGRWEVCTDAEFKGLCVTLTPGEYPTLDPRLNDRISSARELGSNSDNQGSYNNYGRGSLELFGQPDFRGRTLRLDEDAASLRSAGFNDRASSVVVTAGTWQLCSDDGYAGKCRTFTPGRYPDLGYGMAKEVSSARLIRSARDAPAVISNGSGTGPRGSANGLVPGRIVLYGDEGLNGEGVAVSRSFIDLNRTGLGDEGAVSAYVESGSWMLCTHPNFGGACVVVGPGRYDRLGSVGLRRPVASVRPAAAVAAAASQNNRDGIELFAEPGFSGERLAVDRDVPALGRSNFNDRASSVIIYAGKWEFCTDAQHRGNCAVFGPGRYPQIGGMTGRLSSVRRVQ